MNGDIDAEVHEGDRTVTYFFNSLIFYPFLQMNYRCMNYNRVKRMKIHIKKESHYEKNEFCDFVVNTVVPGIEKQYNVYTDPVHNAISGSSLGGMESFYIGMEHPEKFGNIGAMSPSFWMYDDQVWEDYLKQKDFSENAPFVYM